MVRTNAGEPGLLTTAGPLREQGLVSRHAGVGVADAAVPSGRTVASEEPAGHWLIIAQRGTAGRAHVSDLCKHGVVGAANDAGGGWGRRW